MNTTYSFRTDKQVKDEASLVLGNLGTDLSTVFNMCMRQIILKQAVPFEVSMGYNRETLQALRDAKEGKDLIGPFDTIEEMKQALHAED